MKAVVNSKILFYGIGNPGRQDDGLGIEFIENFRSTHKNDQNFFFESNYQLNIEETNILIVQDIDFLASDIWSFLELNFQKPKEFLAFVLDIPEPLRSVIIKNRFSNVKNESNSRLQQHQENLVRHDTEAAEVNKKINNMLTQISNIYKLLGIKFLVATPQTSEENSKLIKLIQDSLKADLLQAEGAFIAMQKVTFKSSEYFRELTKIAFAHQSFMIFLDLKVHLQEAQSQSIITALLNRFVVEKEKMNIEEKSIDFDNLEISRSPLLSSQIHPYHQILAFLNGEYIFELPLVNSIAEYKIERESAFLEENELIESFEHGLQRPETLSLDRFSEAFQPRRPLSMAEKQLIKIIIENRNFRLKTNNDFLIVSMILKEFLFERSLSLDSNISDQKLAQVLQELEKTLQGSVFITKVTESILSYQSHKLPNQINKVESRNEIRKSIDELEMDIPLLKVVINRHQ